jgi:hypothetical protein
MPTFIVLVVLPISLLNITNVFHSIDPVSSLLVGAAATICYIRLGMRKRQNGKKNITLSLYR